MIQIVLNKEVKDAVRLLTGTSDVGTDSKKKLIAIPDKGISADALMSILTSMHGNESTVEEGKAFAYTYTTNRDMEKLAHLMGFAFSMYSEGSCTSVAAIDHLLDQAWGKYMHSNALNPMVICDI